MKNLFGLFFLILIAFLVIHGISCFFPEAFTPTAQEHPRYNSMLKSSDNTTRFSSKFMLGYVYGVLMILVMAISVLIGIRKREKIGTLGKLMIAGFAIYLLIFTALGYTYSQYAGDKNQSFFGGFPLQTAWMIYGMWPLPLFLVFLFSRYFDRWIMTKDDLNQFQTILKKYSNKHGENE